MSCSVSEKVVLGTSAVNDSLFMVDGVAMDFSAVTRMVFEFGDSGVSVDSGITSGVIDWSIGGGVVRTKFGGVVIPARKYLTTVIAYDPAHTDGQVLAHDSGPRLIYQFVDS